MGRAISSAGEHYIDIVGVTGSIPVSPTIAPLRRDFLFGSGPILFNHLRAFFSDHYRWRIGITGNDLRHDGGVYDTEALKTVNPEPLIHHSHFI